MKYISVIALGADRQQDKGLLELFFFFVFFLSGKSKNTSALSNTSEILDITA